MKKIQLSSFLLLVSVSGVLSTAQAGTVVEIQSEGTRSTILSDGKMVRMGMGEGEYAIVDTGKKQVNVVSPQKKQVMLLGTASVASGKPAPKVKVSFRPLGNGRVVAGYKTKKYDYLVNGKSCGILYGSHDAYQQKGVKGLVQAVQSIMDEQQAVMGGFSAFMDDCTQADMQISSYVQKIGIPMLTEKNGRIESEIKSIRTDVELPANTFVIPPSYKRVTMQDVISQVAGAQSGMLPDTPPGSPAAPHAGMGQDGGPSQQQMQGMMRKMQQSGQMTPEMMEQMRQAQEMMMRYQNQ